MLNIFSIIQSERLLPDGIFNNLTYHNGKLKIAPADDILWQNDTIWSNSGYYSDNGKWGTENYKDYGSFISCIKDLGIIRPVVLNFDYTPYFGDKTNQQINIFIRTSTDGVNFSDYQPLTTQQLTLQFYQIKIEFINNCNKLMYLQEL